MFIVHNLILYVSHGKLLMFKSLKCKMFKGLSYMVQLHKVMEHIRGKLSNLKKRMNKQVEGLASKFAHDIQIK